MNQPVERVGGSRAVQGCLIGAVLLFVLLLALLIVLGYRQFREHTADPPSTAILSAPMRIAGIALAALPGIP
jgi:hypothetical protein